MMKSQWRAHRTILALKSVCSVSVVRRTLLMPIASYTGIVAP
jgi:hypothetical protein